MTYLIGSDEKRRGWFVDFYNQWPGLLRPATHNWSDWSFLIFKLAGENSPYKQSWEIEFALLGFHFIATYVYRDADPTSVEPDKTR